MHAAAIVLIYTVSALVPPMWRCPVDWEQMPLAAFVRCSVALESTPASCTTMVRCASVAATPSTRRAYALLRSALEADAGARLGRKPSKHGRAYRLGDPGGGPSIRANVVALPALFAHSLWLGATLEAPPAPIRFAWRPEARAWPPNRVWSTTPPVRGPPERA